MAKGYHHVKPGATTKLCTDCQIEKTFEFFEERRSQCRECRYKQKIARAQSTIVTSRFCKGCSTEKPIDDFPPDKAQRYGRKSRCRECCNKRERKQRPVWKKKNPVKARTKYQKDHTNGKEHRNAYSREWHKKNPDFAYQRMAERRARMHQGKYEAIDYSYVIEQSHNWCYICEKPILPGQKTHFDHVTPLSRHGSHTADNIRLTHGVCNLRKHDFLLQEMTAYQRRGPD